MDNVDDVVSVGQKIQVEITKIDDRGKLSLSPVVAEEEGAVSEEAPAEEAEVSAE
ncbi:polyribonucleotide nucleotidyltransferase [Arthrobacter sp. Hiyo8]|nr:polyribonucleotide nucleotidyltransferase [Arthrobacter sp. Hiyo8]